MSRPDDANHNNVLCELRTIPNTVQARTKTYNKIVETLEGAFAGMRPHLRGDLIVGSSCHT